MENSKNNYRITTIILFIFFVLFTISVKTFDVQNFGMDETPIGYVLINIPFQHIISLFRVFSYYIMAIYNISNYLGYLAIFIILFWCVVAIFQLFLKGSLWKVDPKIISFGIVVVIFALQYVFFDKVVINYRPASFYGNSYFGDVIEEVLESSYPSTHTTLAIMVFACNITIIKTYLKGTNKLKKLLYNIIKIVNIILMITLILCRVISGVHWFTDIVGGVVLGGFLYSLFVYLSQMICYNFKNRTN
ncbi:MAG: phosphatase PAP2 family protein [Eubacteriales bacterium]|nr:phosphatase PAP2 family protein [Eubacteriales bacterium]